NCFIFEPLEWEWIESFKARFSTHLPITQSVPAAAPAHSSSPGRRAHVELRSHSGPHVQVALRRWKTPQICDLSTRKKIKGNQAPATRASWAGSGICVGKKGLASQAKKSTGKRRGRSLSRCNLPKRPETQLTRVSLPAHGPEPQAAGNPRRPQLPSSFPRDPARSTHSTHAQETQSVLVYLRGGRNKPPG
ncbi:Hypothetical predicted protein, partial [Pelobates cultripes]